MSSGTPTFLCALLAITAFPTGCGLERPGGENVQQSNTAARESYVTTADGVRLFVRTLGTGSKTVVIPNAIYMFDDFKHLADARTLVFYDLRNRGHSDAVADSAKLKRGVHQDVDDLEAVRKHLGMEKIDVLGHSYVGLMVALYAMKHPNHVGRVVQIGAAAPSPKNLPASSQINPVVAEVMAQLGKLRSELQGGDPQTNCEKSWQVLRKLYVFNAADVDKISRWGFCAVPNERNSMKHLNENIMPSVLAINLTKEQLANANMPILTIHGAQDWSAPYLGGRDWALKLPDARLITVDNAGHAPWVEDSQLVFTSIDTFLNGEWPKTAQKVTSLDVNVTN
ncbi:MAG: alpha/beta hydrolase [Candidatus Obscuribacterales bacterium]|nr:alpha/beta hydrolase [Steroidobacteraceae bacterium]